MTTYIRENRQFSDIEKVLDVSGTTVWTYSGTTYHITKIRKVDAAYNSQGRLVEIHIPTN